MRQKGSVGDRLVVHGHRIGEPARDAEIIEVMGDQGPYRVRWSSDGRESIVYPGSDTYVEHFTAARRRAVRS